MKVIKYFITQPEGLHARPAAALVEKLNRYQSDITATFGDVTVDAKSSFGLMSLGVKRGDMVVFRVSGEDEAIVKI